MRFAPPALKGLLNALLLCLGTLSVPAATWIGTWATAPVAEPATKEAVPLLGASVRQVVHVSLGGKSLRIRFSNAFGHSPLEIQGARVALSAGGGALVPGSSRPLHFNGQASASIPAGAALLSDPVDITVPNQGDLALTLHLGEVPAFLTVHNGSRTTSYVKPGEHLDEIEIPEPAKVVRWYFTQGIEVLSEEPDAGAIVLLGDSITDGYGTTTDTNQRWPDEFVRRLQATPFAPRGVLNLGIGGNRLLRDGLGPNALARFERDVLSHSGIRWLLVFEGINDIGTRLDARKKGAPYATADDIILALAQLAERGRARGLKVLGATITPYQGADFYWSEDGEADRQKVNAWVRTSGAFDAVVDFDAALRDPAQPSRLLAAYDSGDHLHPSIGGYRRLAEAVDLELFRH